MNKFKTKASFPYHIMHANTKMAYNSLIPTLRYVILLVRSIYNILALRDESIIVDDIIIVIAKNIAWKPL